MAPTEDEPTTHSGHQGRPEVVVIFNQKGGIGKTTTSVNLAACLAALGHRVALIDLDSQGNATANLGITGPLTRGAHDLFFGTASLAEVLRPTDFDRLSVCGATEELTAAEFQLASVSDPQRCLDRAIDAARGVADYVVIDCPPALGLPTVNALVAGDLALMPASPEPMSRDGLAKAWRQIQRVRANLNHRLDVAGILLTMTASDGLHQAMAATIRAEFGARVLATEIPYDPAVVEASSRDLPVVVHAPDSPAAKAYLDVARTVVARTRAARGTDPAGDAATAGAALRAWHRLEDSYDPPWADEHGEEPEAGWVPQTAPAVMPAGFGWRVGVAALLFLLGAVVGFAAGAAWRSWPGPT
ncbi:MAG: ParA family protein [Solirubrobacterales bacterium]